MKLFKISGNCGGLLNRIFIQGIIQYKFITVKNYLYKNNFFYLFNIRLDYNASVFNGNKSFVLATSSKVGTGRIYGILLILGAVACFIMIIFIYLVDKKNSHMTYDIDSLKWN